MYLLGAHITASIDDYFQPGRMAEDLRVDSIRYRKGYRNEFVSTSESSNPEIISGASKCKEIYIMYSTMDNQFHVANTVTGSGLDIIIPINQAKSEMPVHIDVSLKVSTNDHINILAMRNV